MQKTHVAAAQKSPARRRHLRHEGHGLQVPAHSDLSCGHAPGHNAGKEAVADGKKWGRGLGKRGEAGAAGVTNPSHGNRQIQAMKSAPNLKGELYSAFLRPYNSPLRLGVAPNLKGANLKGELYSAFLRLYNSPLRLGVTQS